MNEEELFNILYDKEKRSVYREFQNIESSIEESDFLYKYFTDFEKMLLNDKSYVRLRGFKLICKLSKWDTQNNINKNIKLLLDVLDDDKPTIVRQCLSSLNYLLLYKQELSKEIENKLKNINLLKYKDSMGHLIEKDINSILKNI